MVSGITQPIARGRWAFALLAGLAGASVQAQEFTLTQDEWARPRQGDTLVQMAPLRAAVQAMDGAPGSRLLVHYPGGEEGGLWAHELRAWLIALGVSAQEIELVPGGADSLALRLQVVAAPRPLEARP